MVMNTWIRHQTATFDYQPITNYLKDTLWRWLIAMIAHCTCMLMHCIQCTTLENACFQQAAHLLWQTADNRDTPWLSGLTKGQPCKIWSNWQLATLTLFHSVFGSLSTAPSHAMVHHAGGDGDGDGVNGARQSNRQAPSCRASLVPTKAPLSGAVHLVTSNVSLISLLANYSNIVTFAWRGYCNLCVTILCVVAFELWLMSHMRQHDPSRI